MRFQSTFRLPHRKTDLRRNETEAKGQRKFSAKAPSRASTSMENVLTACVELANLRWRTAGLETACRGSCKKIFQSVVAGMLVLEGDSAGFLCPKSHSAEKTSIAGACSLLCQPGHRAETGSLRSGFLIAPRKASPSITAWRSPFRPQNTVAVLLVVRSNVFSPAEISAFKVLGSIARLALDNSELAGLYCSANA